jgi:hypothetical protein
MDVFDRREVVAIQAAADGPPEGEVAFMTTRPAAQKSTHLELLLDIASTTVLFHSPDHRCFAECLVDYHCENHEIKSTGFKRWIITQFFALHNGAPSADSLQRAVQTLEATADFQGNEEPVYVRVAPGQNGSLYIDLGTPDWNAVCVEPLGWEIIDRPSVRFIRPRGLRPLPVPSKAGFLDVLWEFLNLDPSDRPLVLAWLTASLLPTGPYPVLELTGEQGSAKSTFAKMCRSVVDPHSCMLRSEPREGRDLWIAATNSWLAAFDNLSRLPDWLSDGLCRLSTGGGFAVRSLYSNDEETFFDGQRPVLLAGIEGVASRGDLVDRCLKVALPAIPEDRRRLEANLWEDFELSAGLILGALLNAMAAGMTKVRTVTLDRLPRMADFARWGEAVCQASGFQPGEFIDAYTANRQNATEAILEDSPITGALRLLVPEGKSWEGTGSELLGALSLKVAEQIRQSKRWPKSPRAMSGTIRRLAPALRVAGIDIEFSRDRHARTVTINHRTLAGGNSASPASPASDSSHQTDDANGDPKPANASPASSNDASQAAPSSLRHPCVTRKPSVSSTGDDGDANDARKRPEGGKATTNNRKVLQALGGNVHDTHPDREVFEL